MSLARYAQRMVNDVLTGTEGAKQLTQLEELAVALGGFSHPIKLQIAGLLKRKGKKRPEKTPKAMAAQLDMPLGRLSYHVRQMAEVGLIRETRVEPVRGALAHYYELSDVGHEWMKRFKL